MGPEIQTDSASEEVSTRHLLETYYNGISETVVEPPKAHTSQLDALIDKMEQFNLEPGAETRIPPDSANDNAPEDVPDPNPSQKQKEQKSLSTVGSASCKCKPTARALKGLSSSRFASENAALSNAGNFTLPVNIQAHDPTCPLFSSSKSSLSSNKKNRPAFASE